MRITSKRIGKMLGVTRRTVVRWVDRGILRPSGESRFSYELIDVLAAGVALDMQHRGCGRGQILVVVNWLRSVGLERLRSQWKDGRRFLLSVGTEPLFRRLFSWGEIFDNEGVDLKAAHDAGVCVAIVDVEKCHRLLLERLAEVEATEKVRK